MTLLVLTSDAAFRASTTVLMARGGYFSPAKLYTVTNGYVCVGVVLMPGVYQFVY